MDLEEHKENIKKEKLQELIESTSQIPGELRYDREGNIMDEDYFNRLIHNFNLESYPASISIKYGGLL